MQGSTLKQQISTPTWHWDFDLRKMTSLYTSGVGIKVRTEATKVKSSFLPTNRVSLWRTYKSSRANSYYTSSLLSDNSVQMIIF